ncbi:MAG TPA: bacillithiol biosynthesis deacetylase BshB1 [Thermoanaerobaculia bacterium]|nr:bacillithiol biosynthesis deacetylase BshB1 [Thermoanaerobaculia bacterium]
MSEETVDVLAVSAHPDDVEMSCGGTLARVRASGRTFGILDLTGGEMGTRGTPRTRAEEAQRAAEILGASFRRSLDLGDGGLRTGRPEELLVIDEIRRARPRIVVAPFPEDRHPDHARAGALVRDAAFYAGLRKIETAHPAHRPQQVLFFSTLYEHRPDFVVDVSATHEIKMRAIRAFASQFHDPASKEPATMLSSESFLGFLEGRARNAGASIGVAFGEAFRSMRPPRIDDVVAAFEGFEPGF